MIFAYIFLVLVVIALFSFLKKKRNPPPPKALQIQHTRTTLNCPLLEKQMITHDTYLFKFGLPSPNHVLGISVGEHITISQTIPTKEHPEGELVERKYTPTSPVDQKGSFELLIKIYRPNQQFPNGGKLTYWLDTIQVGQNIEILGPFGRLQYLNNGNFLISRNGVRSVQNFKRIAMVAGGSGITPMYQIIQQIFLNGSDRTKISLLFANKYKEDILLYDSLKSFEKQNILQLFLTLDNPPPDWEYFQGFVTKEMLQKCFEVDNQTIYLLCGPPPMTKSAFDKLVDMKVSETNIHIF